MTMDLLANRKHLNEILERFFIRTKCNQRNFAADVTSDVHKVTGIEICVQTHCICHE